MDKTCIFAIALLCALHSVHMFECESGWTAFKDEACIKVFDELLSHNDAKRLCTSKGNGHSTASLVMVKDAAMQELLMNNTQDVLENMWLGGRYDGTSGQFIWNDGEPLKYTNWANGYPRNNGSETCILLRSVHTKDKTPSLLANWEDAVCQQRNRVICQQAMTWNVDDAVREILKLRRNDIDLNIRLNDAKNERDNLRSELQAQIDTANRERNQLHQLWQETNSKVVPVGSIYVEYYGQPSPPNLWPSLRWEDVTSSYAGLFFRALGGGSAVWGNNQAGCSPRISSVEYTDHVAGPGWAASIRLPSSGWSEWILSGANYVSGTKWHEKQRFLVETCETRPTNQAIRIWKRLA